MKNTTLTVEALQNAAAITAEIESLTNEVNTLTATVFETQAALKSKVSLLASKRAEVARILGRTAKKGRAVGYKVSEETRAKMRESHQRRLAAKALVNTPVDATAGVTLAQNDGIVDVKHSVGLSE